MELLNELEKSIEDGKKKKFETAVQDDTELKHNWRSEISMTANELREMFHGLTPTNEIGAKRYNILLVGIIGAGKSSFCNTFYSAVTGRVTQVAVSGDADYSVTNRVSAYQFVPKEHTMSVQLIDIRGIEETRGLEHEIDHLLDGELPNNYVFKDKSTAPTTNDLKKETDMGDKIHLLCVVFDATKIEILTEKHMEHVKCVKSTAQRKGLQIVGLVSNIDELCPKVSADLNHLFKSPTILKVVEQTSALLGIQRKHVFPVCNYTNEKENVDSIDMLALDSVLNMIQIIEDYFKRFEEPKLKTDGWRSRGQGLKEKSVIVKKQIDSYEYSGIGNDHGFRVLVMGAKECGKSSYLNSVRTSLLGKISSKIPAGSSAAKRTNKIQAYPLKSVGGDGTVTTPKVTMVDMPGLIEEESEINDSDISFVLGGHVPNKFQFKEHVSESMDKLKANPKVGDKYQCVCIIIDITDIGDMARKINQRIHSTQKVLSDKEIPFVILLTNVDKLCPALEADVSKVYESKKIKKCVDEIIKLFDISYVDIFPIKNYTVYSTTSRHDMDALILESLKAIMDRCKEFLENYEESDEE